MEDSQINIALEELKMCQGVIEQQEQIIYRRQGWYFALFTGLTVVVLKKEAPFISPDQYLWISVALTLLFYISDLIQRLPHSRAIQRARFIEDSLRGEKNYNGPILSSELGEGKGCGEVLSFCFQARVVTPYIVIIIIVAIIYALFN